MVLWGESGERKVVLNRLMPLGPFVPNVSWDELPLAFMAIDSDHWGLLGNSQWVHQGEPQGCSNNLLESNKEWDSAIAVEPVEGQPKPPQRTKLDGWVTVLCLFAGIGVELEGLLKAGIWIRKLLVVEIDLVARRILGYRVRALHRRYPDQLPAVACEGLLTGAAPGHQAGGVAGAEEVHANPHDDNVLPLPRAFSRQPQRLRTCGSPVGVYQQGVADSGVPEQAPDHEAGLYLRDGRRPRPPQPRRQKWLHHHRPSGWGGRRHGYRH
jgi:hypothetical protein